MYILLYLLLLYTFVYIICHIPCTKSGIEQSKILQIIYENFCFIRTSWDRLVKVQSIRVNFKTFHSLTLWDTLTQKLQLQSSPNYFAGITVSSTTFLQNFRAVGSCRLGGKREKEISVCLRLPLPFLCAEENKVKNGFSKLSGKRTIECILLWFSLPNVLYYQVTKLLKRMQYLLKNKILLAVKYMCL